VGGRTPGAGLTNIEETRNPVVTDDDSEALDIGSQWINLSTGQVWYCVDNAVGAAIWKDVSTPGAGSHPVTVSASDPLVTSDSNAGFSVGDHWINTTAKTVYQAIDVSVGAAVWERIDGPRNNVTTSNPSATDDASGGYEIGSRWINTTFPYLVWRATDVSAAAAVWVRENNVKVNTGATTDPSVTNDNTEGYEVGSLWINTTDGSAYVATSVGTGAAAWKTSSLSGATPVVNPGELMFGTLLDYPSAGNVSAGTVFFLRLKISAGVVLANMRTFIDSGGTASRNLRMGIYDQTDPADPTLGPNARVTQTDPDDTAGDSGTFKTMPLLGGDYTVPVTGFYWLAIVSDSTSLKFAVSAAVRANFLPVRQETSTGTTLPATTGVLTNPVSSVLYLAAVEA